MSLLLQFCVFRPLRDHLHELLCLLLFGTAFCQACETFRRVDPLKPVSMSCPYVRLSARPSTRSFNNLNEIWNVGMDQCVIHDSMPYDPIQDQGQRGLKVLKMPNFKVCLLCRNACNQKTNSELWYFKKISDFSGQIFDIRRYLTFWN